jgi:hypothetical protein
MKKCTEKKHLPRFPLSIVTMLLVVCIFGCAGPAPVAAWDWQDMATRTSMGESGSTIGKGVALGALIIAAGILMWLGWKSDREGYDRLIEHPTHKPAVPLKTARQTDTGSQDETLALALQAGHNVELTGMGLRVRF